MYKYEPYLASVEEKTCFILYISGRNNAQPKKTFMSMDTDFSEQYLKSAIVTFIFLKLLLLSVYKHQGNCGFFYLFFPPTSFQLPLLASSIIVVSSINIVPNYAVRSANSEIPNCNWKIFGWLPLSYSISIHQHLLYLSNWPIVQILFQKNI